MLYDVVDNVNSETTTIDLEALTKVDNNEEEHPDAVPKDFEEDLKFREEWLENPQLIEDCMVIE